MGRRRHYSDRFSVPRRVFRPIILTPRPHLAHVAMIDDRRVFHPEGALRSPLSIRGPRIPRLVIPKRNTLRKFKSVVPATVGFSAPRAVSVCVRRHRRKEVIFAKRLAGKGSRSPKRRNYWSEVSC